MPCLSGLEDYENNRAFESATRAACELARWIRLDPTLWRKAQTALSGETLLWIEEHDAVDAEREKREAKEKEDFAIASQARAKLTPKEREVLGI